MAKTYRETKAKETELANIYVPKGIKNKMYSDEESDSRTFGYMTPEATTTEAGNVILDHVIQKSNKTQSSLRWQLEKQIDEIYSKGYISSSEAYDDLIKLTRHIEIEYSDKEFEGLINNDYEDIFGARDNPFSQVTRALAR